MSGDVQISSARCGGTANALKGMFKYECSNISVPPYALLRYLCGPRHTTDALTNIGLSVNCDLVEFFLLK